MTARCAYLFNYQGKKLVLRSGGVATLCYHLDRRSVRTKRDKDVRRRGVVLRHCTSRRRFLGAGFFISSKFSNIDFRHRKLRTVLRRIRTKQITAIVAGSLSHLNEGCLGANRLVRVMFPRGKMHCVTVGSKISATQRSGRFAPLQG